jgi:hypothetical protein
VLTQRQTPALIATEDLSQLVVATPAENVMVTASTRMNRGYLHAKPLLLEINLPMSVLVRLLAWLAHTRSAEPLSAPLAR